MLVRSDGERRWPGPPLEFRPAPPWLSHIVRLLWYAVLALALFAQAGTVWRVYNHFTAILPTFASLGLEVTGGDVRDWHVRRATDAAYRAGVRPKTHVFQVNGREVGKAESAADVAGRLAGPDGGAVTIGLRSADKSWQVRLIRTQQAREEIYSQRFANRTFMIFGSTLDLLVALLLVTAAIVLRWRKSDDSIATLLSFALLFGAANLGTDWIWVWLQRPAVPWLLSATWITLFLVALPAFPSGRYAPPWTRWFMVAGPLVAIAIVYPTGPLVWQVKAALFPAIALLLTLARVENADPGAERQQTKWAALALTVGFLLYAVGSALPFLEANEIVTATSKKFALYYLSYALTRAAFVVIPAGLLVAIFGYRLHDADAAIGRSAGYALITTVVAVVWASSETWTGGAVKRLTGGNSPALATGVSTLLALLVFGPARTRILGWTEARFQQALAGLRSIPERLLRWQHEDDPKTVAARAVEAIATGMGASSAVLALDRGADGLEVVGAYGIDPDIARRDLSGPDAVDHFPLRLPIDDCPPVGLLAIGRRVSRGAYSTAEQAALLALLVPLADVLRAVSARAGRNGRVAERLDAMARKLDHLEGSHPGHSRSTGLQP